jgi:hypothetical protein
MNVAPAVIVRVLSFRKGYHKQSDKQSEANHPGIMIRKKKGSPKPVVIPKDITHSPSIFYLGWFHTVG